MIRKAIRGVWSTSSKVAEKEIQIRLEVPTRHIKLVAAVIFDVLIILKTWKYRETFLSANLA
jgi:hypothetical protein